MNRVLILSRSADGHVERLTAELDRLGVSWILFDPGAFPASVDFTMLMENDVRMLVRLPDGSLLNLEEIDAVWYRRPSPIKADQQMPELQRLFIEREARAGV